VRKFKLSKQTLSIDKNLLLLIVLFVFVGLVAVADASAPQALNNYGDKFFLFKQQVVSAGVGFVVLFITSKLHYSLWEKLATPLFFLALLLLLVVLLPQVGFKALGARRWIDLGFTSFQPSEAVKLGMAVYLAKVASKNKTALAYFLPVGVVALLIMLQPDLGTTLVVAIIGLSQIFVSGLSLLYFGGAVGLGAVVTYILILVSPYRKARLLSFLQAERDPLGSSYHIRQILLGLGSGGVFGVGLGASRQKYLFLPESSTDSIFAVIAEELGLIGGLAIIFLFAFFVWKGLIIAKNAPDNFSRVLAVGITAWIGGQAFLNIAANVALVPLTGIPLPFISYGGTSLVTVMAACGILLSISRYAPQTTKRR
jgi:cell division protein FtsW